MTIGTLPRYRQIRRADNVDDQEDATAILGALPSSVTQEDLQAYFLSRLREVIFGADPGKHWYDDFEAQGILSLKELSAASPATAPVRTGFEMVGPKDAFNRVFRTTPLKFVHDPSVSGKTISVWHNGRRLIHTPNGDPAKGDYTVSESGGFGSGYDTINLLTFAPVGRSSLVADFHIA